MALHSEDNSDESSVDSDDDESDLTQLQKSTVKVFHQAASLGHPISLYMVGDMYLRGIGVPVDNKKALFYLTQAVEKKVPEAQNKLGEIYEKGEIVQQDKKKAFELYSLAAAQGNLAAQNNLKKLR